MVTDDPAADVAFEHAPVGMALLRPDGAFVRVNRALCELLAYRGDELLRLRCQDVTHPDEDPDPVSAELREGAARTIVDKRYLTAHGEPLWVSVATAMVRDDDGEPRFLVAQVQDVSERRRLEEDLRHAADHDPLTGLLNRRRFARDLAHQVEVSRRYGAPAAVILLDLDYLKQVNDTRGHRAGDQLLGLVARMLGRRVRASDVLARLGGDEFAVLLPHTNPDEALALAEALVDAVRAAAPYGCTASAGVAPFGIGAPDAAELLARADAAMYTAKRGGRNRAVLA